jgi:HPt (histidine-containing phosphotransfer) domain-containing protein
MTTSPPKDHRPSGVDGAERPAFVFSGLLAPLIEAGYDEDAREVVRLYLEDHTAKLAQISEALERGDLESCANAAHSLVGSAGGIGAKELAMALNDLETACRSGGSGAIERAKVAVEAEQDRVLLAVRQFLVGGPADG